MYVSNIVRKSQAARAAHAHLVTTRGYTWRLKFTGSARKKASSVVQSLTLPFTSRDTLLSLK